MGAAEVATGVVTVLVSEVVPVEFGIGPGGFRANELEAVETNVVP